MDIRHRLYLAREGGASDTRNDAVILFCVGVVAVCFAAPLLLTLPQTLDAAERPVAASIERAASGASEAPDHERYPVQATSDWVDSLEETELAVWRQRASD